MLVSLIEQREESEEVSEKGNKLLHIFPGFGQTPGEDVLMSFFLQPFTGMARIFPVN